MSLINEALKKAQARQTGGSLDTRGPPSGGIPPGPPRPSHQSSQPNWIAIGAILIVVTVCVAGATWLVLWGLQSNPEPTETVVQTQPQPSQETAGNSTEQIDRIQFKPPEESTKTMSPSPPPAAQPPVKQPAAQRPTTPTAQTTPQTPVAQTPVASEPTSTPNSATAGETTSENGRTTPAEPTEAGPKPVAQPDVEAFLTKVEIRGIMLGGSKVLIYHPELGRTVAYENGSEMEADLEIKIHNVYKDRIAFIDDGGFIYIKRF